MDLILRTGRAGRSKKSFDQREAEGLYNAQMLAAVARLMRRGCTIRQAARILQVPQKVVEHFWEWALERAELREAVDRPISGEVLPAPEEEKIRRDVYELRKRAYPYDDIAVILNISPSEARRHVRTQLFLLQQDEVSDTDMARRLQVDQLDAMIQAIFPDATGETGRVDYDAIDRMVKLLGQKAKLLGLEAEQRIDIRHRIELIAEENGYDLAEVREIATHVVERYRERALR